MPEDDFETAEFKERLEEATERAVEAAEHRERWIIYLSLSTAIIAVLAAVAALGRARVPFTSFTKIHRTRSALSKQ